MLRPALLFIAAGGVIFMAYTCTADYAVVEDCVLALFAREGDEEALTELFKIDQDAWRKECEELEHYFPLFGHHLPKEISQELSALEQRVAANSSH